MKFKASGLAKVIPVNKPLPLFIVAGLIFLGIVVFLFSLLQSPVISSIEPAMAAPGDVIVIKGRNMGIDQYSSWLSIDGRRIAATHILEWTPGQISLRVPYNVFSGLMVIHNGNRETDGVLFINTDQLPQLTEESTLAKVKMTRLEPSVAEPGQEVALIGRRFGAEKDRFTLYCGLIPVQADDIISWSDMEIRFLVPFSQGKQTVRLHENGIELGTLELSVQPRWYEVLTQEALVRHLTIGYGLGDVELTNQEGNGSLTLNLPRVPESPYQRVRYESYLGPYDHHPVRNMPLDLYTLANPLADTSYDLRASLLIKTEAKKILPKDELPQERGHIPSPLISWTKASPMVPVGDGAMKSLVKSVSTATLSDYGLAQKLHDAVISLVEPKIDGGLVYGPEVLKDGTGSSFSYASLLVGLYRTAGLPARMIEGYILDASDKASAHYWVEVYLPGMSWVQADPFQVDHEGLAGRRLGDFDNRHIMVIREGSIRGLTRIDDRTIQLFRKFVLLDVHAESSGNVESFGLSLPSPLIRRIDSQSFIP